MFRRRHIFNLHRPELHAQSDPLDNTVEAHNAWVVSKPKDYASPPVALLTTQQSDGVTQYIDWATKHGFGVMDANVPSYITKPEVSRAHSYSTKTRKLTCWAGRRPIHRSDK